MKLVSQNNEKNVSKKSSAYQNIDELDDIFSDVAFRETSSPPSKKSKNISPSQSLSPQNKNTQKQRINKNVSSANQTINRRRTSASNISNNTSTQKTSSKSKPNTKTNKVSNTSRHHQVNNKTRATTNISQKNQGYSYSNTSAHSGPPRNKKQKQELGCRKQNQTPFKTSPSPNHSARKYPSTKKSQNKNASATPTKNIPLDSSLTKKKKEKIYEASELKNKKFIGDIIFGWILNIELTITIILVCALIAPQLFGIYPDVVLSASMQRIIPQGSIAYINHNITPMDLQIDDIAVYEPSETTKVMHRIVSIENGMYQFKGDENQEVDKNLAQPNQVLGKYMFHIPNIGVFYSYVEENRAAFIIGIVLFNLVLYLLVKIFKPDKSLQE